MSQPQLCEAAKALVPNDSLVARQSIVNASKDPFGFELFFRDSWENRFPDVSSEEATSRLTVDSQPGVWRVWWVPGQLSSTFPSGRWLLKFWSQCSH